MKMYRERERDERERERCKIEKYSKRQRGWG